ncbi:MAG: CHASE domain-containing protein [Chloroflexales bacterium]
MKARSSLLAILPFLGTAGTVAALYALLTQISVLSFTPFTDTPLVWPPTGFAVASVLVLERRFALPGIWLGMFVVSSWLVFILDAPLVALLAAAAIACGTAAHAAVTAYLLHRYTLIAGPHRVRGWSILSTILKVGLIAGLTSVISTTINTVVQINIGLVGPNEQVRDWALWWINDIFGVMLVTPPLLWLGLRIRSWPATRQIALATLNIGLIISICLFFILWRMDLDRIAVDFEGESTTAVITIHTQLAQYIHDVEMLSGLFTASDQSVSRAEFHTFVQMHMMGADQSPGIQSLVWAPVVTAAERPAYEAAMRAGGFPGFRITELDKQGMTVRAGERGEYVVTDYNEPLETNLAAIGYDVNSSPILREAIVRARDSGGPAATEPIYVATNQAQGFLILWPIYRAGAATDTVAARRASIRGFVMGVFRIQEMMGTVLQAPTFSKIDISVFDEGSSTGADTPFYVYSENLVLCPSLCDG